MSDREVEEFRLAKNKISIKDVENFHSNAFLKPVRTFQQAFFNYRKIFLFFNYRKIFKEKFFFIRKTKKNEEKFDFFSAEILKELDEQNFTEPTPIQSQMWPLALQGFDVIGIAQTGTGKTLGFLLPIFIHIENQPV